MPNSKPSTSTDDIYHDFLEQLVKTEDYKAILNELLAVIHRDGGHYTLLAGFVASVEDAMHIVQELRADNRWLSATISRLRKGEPDATQEGQKPEGR
jgi:hypothetical protein